MPFNFLLSAEYVTDYQTKFGAISEKFSLPEVLFLFSIFKLKKPQSPHEAV